MTDTNDMRAALQKCVEFIEEQKSLGVKFPMDEETFHSVSGITEGKAALQHHGKQVPDGYKLVPIKPTKAMLQALNEHDSPYMLRRALDKSCWEIAIQTNDDWRECIEQIKVVRRFKTEERAAEAYYKILQTTQYEAMLAAAPAPMEAK